MKKKESESYLLYLTIDESRRNSKTKKEAKRMKEEEWRHDWFLEKVENVKFLYFSQTEVVKHGSVQQVVLVLLSKLL